MPSGPRRNGRSFLRLYVAGAAPNSLRAVTNARAICEAQPAPGYELEIVDVLLHPRRALADGILVTPTLLRVSPLPTLKIVGSLSDKEQVLQMLVAK